MQYLLRINTDDSEIVAIYRLQLSNGSAILDADAQNFVSNGEPEPTLEKPLRIYWQKPLHPYNVQLASMFAKILIYNYNEMEKDVQDIEDHFLDRIKRLSTFLRHTKEMPSTEMATARLDTLKAARKKRCRLNERRVTVRIHVHTFVCFLMYLKAF